jgi:hypothetical protein
VTAPRALKPGVFVEQHSRAAPLLSRQAEGNTPEQEFAAAKYVVRQAESEEEATELLQMLGLVDPPWEWVGGRSGARRRVER